MIFVKWMSKLIPLCTIYRVRCNSSCHMQIKSIKFLFNNSFLFRVFIYNASAHSDRVRTLCHIVACVNCHLFVYTSAHSLFLCFVDNSLKLFRSFGRLLFFCYRVFGFRRLLVCQPRSPLTTNANLNSTKCCSSRQRSQSVWSVCVLRLVETIRFCFRFVNFDFASSETDYFGWNYRNH